MVAEYGWRKPSVVTETYAYDPLRRLTGVADSEGFEAIYEYDAAGNRTRWWANDDQTTQTPWDGLDVSYEYDDADRLLRAGDTHYAYDANGNRINANWPGPPGPNTQGVDYTYDREDRLVVGQAYQTNHKGHRVDREVTRLFYDGLGLRLAKEYDPKDGGGGGVKRTEYTFDGLDPVVEYSLWNGQREEFYRGEGAQLLTMRHFPDGTEGQSYWYHHDGRGSIAGVTKHQGQSTHNYRYDAYGQLLPARGNWSDPHNHYTFSGKEWDEALGLYEFGARLYDPWAGLWLTQDPLRGEVRRPRTLHRYAYAFASPISYYDRYGLQGEGPQPEPVPTPPTPGPTPTPSPPGPPYTPTPTPTGAQWVDQCSRGPDYRGVSGEIGIPWLMMLTGLGFSVAGLPEVGLPTALTGAVLGMSPWTAPLAVGGAFEWDPYGHHYGSVQLSWGHAWPVEPVAVNVYGVKIFTEGDRPATEEEITEFVPGWSVSAGASALYGGSLVWNPSFGTDFPGTTGLQTGWGVPIQAGVSIGFAFQID